MMRGRARKGVLGALAASLLGVALLPASASAAPPANDSFSAAQVLPATSTFSVAGTNVEATKETGEPNHIGPTFIGPKNSVWYSWTPAQDALVKLEVCDFEHSGSFFPHIAIYSGTAVNALTLVKKNGCIVALNSQAGATYRIAIDHPDEGAFTLSSRIPNRPANDDFADAQALAGPLPITAGNVNAADATDEPGEPVANRFSVWFKWTAQASEPVSLDVCEAGPIYRPAVYTGSTLGSLTEVISDDECRLIFDAEAGTEYRIAVWDPYQPSEDQFAHFDLTIRALDRPANDDFADAQEIATLPARIETDNIDATPEDGEPQHYTWSDSDGDFSSVWFKWTAPFDGLVHVDVCEIFYKHHGVAVYTGSSLDTVSWVDDSRQGCRSYFQAVQGETYMIAADSPPSEQSRFALAMHRMNPPPNDAFETPTVLSPALPVTAEGTSLDSTGQPDEPDHFGFDQGARGSTWYSWTPDETAEVAVDACSGISDALAVYTGDEIDDLTLEAEAENWCRLTFIAEAGVEYRIAAEENQYQGPYTLDIHELDVPPNDDFADAEELSDFPSLVPGTTADSSFEEDETGSWQSSTFGTVWYRWTPTDTADLAVNVCDSDRDRTDFTVYTGSEVDDLTEIAGSGEGCVAHLTAQAGTTYSLAVRGRTIGRGFTLDVHELSPPANDDFAHATPITTLPAQFAGTTADADREQYEVDDMPATVWYRWTPDVTTYATFDTCDSAYDTYIAAYSGVSQVSDFQNFGTWFGYGSNDDGCTGPNPKGSRMQFQGVPGKTYYIQVGGDGEGAFTLRASGETYSPPLKVRSGNKCDGTKNEPDTLKCALKRCSHRPKAKRGPCEKKARKRFSRRKP